jgi:hypothetical protein
MMIAYGAAIHIVLQNLADRPESMAEAIATAARRLVPLAGVSIALLLIEATGSPVLPILMWMDWLVMGSYFAAAPICIAEQAGVGTALSRCRFLTRGAPLANLRRDLAGRLLRLRDRLWRRRCSRTAAFSRQRPPLAWRSTTTAQHRRDDRGLPFR